MISACILVRDDAETLDACLASIKPHVDELICVDTGSIDDSPAIAKKYADIWTSYLGCNDRETEQIADFADARNHALSLAHGDWHFWADADDVLVGGEHLRSLASHASPRMWLIGYEYSHDAAGRPTCIHWRENLVSPCESFKWQIPVHEVLVPQGIAPAVEPTQLVRRVHRKQLSKKTPDPERNLRILKKYVAQVGEGDVRAWYYLGVEYSMRGDVPNALRVLKRYVELSGWADEKCLALLELGNIYQRLGDLNVAVEWALKAVTTKSWPEPYYLMAECYAAMSDMGVDRDQNIRRAAHFAELGLTLPPTSTVLFVNPMKRFSALSILHRIYAHFGDLERALKTANELLSGIPEDEPTQLAALQYQDVLSKNSIVSAVQRHQALAAELQRRGAYDPGQHALLQKIISDALGITAQSAPQLPAPSIEPQAKGDGCLDIVLFVGPQYEPWNPVTLAQAGMGGSETMAWEMSKRLRALGHRVRVFGQCTPDQEGVFEGVEWLDWQRYRDIDCDVLICSRRPDAADISLPIKARARLLWVHDVHVGDALTPARALRFDRVLALSEWHKKHLLETYSGAHPGLIAKLAPGDVFVTRNGIDSGAYDAPVERNPKRLIYSSSPDRGLLTLLELWPAIRVKEPEAELRVLYGLQNWEKSVAAGMRTEIPWLSEASLRRVKLLVRSLPGVTHLGRVSPSALVAEFLSAGVWAYPTWFAETFAITAAQAQAAGCYTVATPIAALNETVGDAGVLIGSQDSWWQGGTAQDRGLFVDAVVSAIRGENQPKTREELQAGAARFSLDALAKDWDKMLRDLLVEIGERVVPEWRE